MAEGKKSFTFYCDWIDTFEALPDEKAGQLIKHILRYVNDENPETEDLLITAVFANIRTTLKRDLKKWKIKSLKNSQNARMRWDANACERIKRNANYADKDKDKDKDIEEDKASAINALLSSFLLEVKSGMHSQAIEGWKMSLKLREGSLERLVKDFNTQLLTDNKLHKNTLELRKHFKRWLDKLDQLGKLNDYKR